MRPPLKEREMGDLIVRTFEDYVQKMIKNGYWSEKDLEPIKCEYCDSKNLEDTNFLVEELGTHCVTEFKRVCKDCEKEVGYWSYGQWMI